MGTPGAPQPAADPEDPRHWLGRTPLIDLEDPKLRLRVRSLTQLGKTDRERALAVYAFVKRMPLARAMKLRLRTAREVLDAGRGDAPDKATLLVAMLRIARLPARVRYVALRGAILRGLASGVHQAARPVLEVWLHGRWVRTDTYIFDAAYMAAARQHLKDHAWEWGYGIHVDGAMVWDGSSDSFVGGPPTQENPMLVADLGAYSDPLEFVSSPAYLEKHRKWARQLHWNVLAPLMQRAIRSLRDDKPVATGVRGRKLS